MKKLFDKFMRIGHREDGVVLVEFAYVLPFFVVLGFTAIEVANLAVTNMRVSQMAMTVADNLSRAKQTVPLGLPQLREVDVNDTLLGAEIQGGDDIDIWENGRVIVTSLQQTSAGLQTVKWQRCKGKYNAASLYGSEGDTEPNSGSGGFQGMGTGATQVRAEPNSAVIFAEVVYNYKPLFGDWLLGSKQIRREAAFYVRDDRDLSRIYNPNPRPRKARCDRFDDRWS